MSTITKQHLRYYVVGLGFSLFYGVYQSLPILFYHPNDLQCMSNDNKLVTCSEADICSGKYAPQIIMDQTGIESLSMYYFMYCDNRIQEVYIMAITNSARTIGYLINWLYMAQPRNYLYILCINNIITGIFNLITYWYDNLQYVVYAQIIWSFNYTTFYTYAYAYGAFFAPDENKETATTFYNLTQPVGGLMYILFAMYYPSWKQTTAIYAGVFQIANGIILYLLRFTKEEYDAVPQTFNDGMNFKDCVRTLRLNPDYWSNLKIWTWIAVAVNSAFFSSLTGFGQGGDIFLNLIVSSFLEVIAGSSAHFVVGRLNLFKFTRNILIFLGLSYITSSSVNSLTQSPGAQKTVLYIIIQLWPVVWGKIAHLSLNSMFYKILDEMFPTNLGTFSCSWIQFFSQIWISIMPFYRYIMLDILEVNQYFGEGMVFLSAAWVSTKMLRVCQEHLIPKRDIELKEIQTPASRQSAASQCSEPTKDKTTQDAPIHHEDSTLLTNNSPPQSDHYVYQNESISEHEMNSHQKLLPNQDTP